MFCPGCGTQMPDEAAFCMKCGINIKQIKEGGQAQVPNSAPAPNPYPYPPVNPYPVSYPPQQKTNSRNAVSFTFALLSACAFVGALITLLSATSSLSIFGETVYRHADEEVALLAAVIGGIGFIFGLVGLLTSPKKEEQNSLGTFGKIFGTVMMCASAVIAVISLLTIDW